MILSSISDRQLRTIASKETPIKPKNPPLAFYASKNKTERALPHAKLNSVVPALPSLPHPTPTATELQKDAGKGFSASLGDFLRLRGQQVAATSIVPTGIPALDFIPDRRQPARRDDDLPQSIISKATPLIAQDLDMKSRACLIQQRLVKNQKLLLLLESRLGFAVTEIPTKCAEADVVLSTSAGVLVVNGYELTQRKPISNVAGGLLDAIFAEDKQPAGSDILVRISTIAHLYESLTILVDICTPQEKQNTAIR